MVPQHLDGVFGARRRQAAAVEVESRLAPEGGSVQEAADSLHRLLGPEAGVLGAPGGVAHQGDCPAHGGPGPFAAPDRRPAGRRGYARGQALGVEHGHRPSPGPGRQGDGQVVGPGAGGDERPGGVRTIGTTRWRPLPAPGGPEMTVESRTQPQHSTPRERPSRKPTSTARGLASEGRSTGAFPSSAFVPAAAVTWRREASPGRRCGSSLVVAGPWARHRSRRPTRHQR